LLEGDLLGGGGRIDLRTGTCWPDSLDHDKDDTEEDEDRWLYVDCIGSDEGYGDMELFIGTVGDPGIADRLEIAISGKGAFWRCKDVLSRWPDELQRYFLLSDERKRGRTRAWLAGKGYRRSAQLPSDMPRACVKHGCQAACLAGTRTLAARGTPVRLHPCG